MRTILSPNATFSTTVFHVNNPKCLKTIATPSRGERVGSPSIRICPELGVKSPPMQRSNVVFPQPEGPTTQRTSLLLTFSSILRKATTVPSRKSLLAWSTTILAPSAIARDLEFEIRSVNPYQGIPELSSRVRFDACTYSHSRIRIISEQGKQCEFSPNSRSANPRPSYPAKMAARSL